jgi:hypothetical protein
MLGLPFRPGQRARVGIPPRPYACPLAANGSTIAVLRRWRRQSNRSIPIGFIRLRLDLSVPRGVVSAVITFRRGGRFETFFEGASDQIAPVQQINCMILYYAAARRRFRIDLCRRVSMIGIFGTWSSNRQWRGLDGAIPTKVASWIVAASTFRRNASRLRRNAHQKKRFKKAGLLDFDAPKVLPFASHLRAALRFAVSECR